MELLKRTNSYSVANELRAVVYPPKVLSGYIVIFLPAFKVCI